jgi:hypothetical protein
MWVGNGDVLGQHDLRYRIMTFKWYNRGQKRRSRRFSITSVDGNHTVQATTPVNYQVIVWMNFRFEMNLTTQYKAYTQLSE